MLPETRRQSVLEVQDDGTVILRCIGCSYEFSMSAGEQQYYRARDMHQPRRCPSCRRKRREQANHGEHGQALGHGRGNHTRNEVSARIESKDSRG